MMATVCSCRASALRLFVRSVAQVHYPNEALVRSPWRETRRQIHKHTTTTAQWPVVTNLHYAMHTAAESVTPSQDGNARLLSAEEHESSQQAVASSPGAEAGAQPEVHREQPKSQGTSVTDDTLLLDDKETRRKKRKQEKTRARIAAKQSRLVFPALRSPTAPHPETTADHLKEAQDGETKERPDQTLKEKKKLARMEAARLKREAAAAKSLSKNSFKKHQRHVEKTAEKHQRYMDKVAAKKILKDARKARREAAALRTEDPADHMKELRDHEDKLFDVKGEPLLDLPEEPTFSVEEELRIAEGRKAKAEAERAMKKEKYLREKEKMKKQEERERERERQSNKPNWAIQKEALKKKFPEGWRPHKRLSPDALNGIRTLHAQFPDMYTTAVLAEKFEVSAEAIRRILRTKWAPRTEEEDADRHRRWKNRGTAIWEKYAALGKKPPKKWRDAGIAMKVWGGLEPEGWDGEEEGMVQGDGWRRPRQEDLREQHLVEEFDEVELEKARRLQTQRRLAENLL